MDTQLLTNLVDPILDQLIYNRMGNNRSTGLQIWAITLDSLDSSIYLLWEKVSYNWVIGIHYTLSLYDEAILVQKYPVYSMGQFMLPINIGVMRKMMVPCFQYMKAYNGYPLKGFPLNNDEFNGGAIKWRH